MRIIIAVGIAMLIGLESNHVFEVLAKGREDWLWKGRLANVIKEKMEGGERHPIKPSLRQEPVDREVAQYIDGPAVTNELDSAVVCSGNKYDSLTWAINECNKDTKCTWLYDWDCDDVNWRFCSGDQIDGHEGQGGCSKIKPVQCESNTDCPSNLPTCGNEGFCKACTSDADCTSPQTCQDSVCVTVCTSNDDCTSPQTCQDSVCETKSTKITSTNELKLVALNKECQGGTDVRKHMPSGKKMDILGCANLCRGVSTMFTFSSEYASCYCDLGATAEGTCVGYEETLSYNLFKYARCNHDYDCPAGVKCWYPGLPTSTCGCKDVIPFGCSLSSQGDCSKLRLHCDQPWNSNPDCPGVNGTVSEYCQITCGTCKE